MVDHRSLALERDVCPSESPRRDLSQANKRKILAATSGDPHEEARLLFNKQLEVTVLEGKIKQRQHLLDLTADGVAKDQVIRVPPGRNSSGFKIPISFQSDTIAKRVEPDLRSAVW